MKIKKGIFLFLLFLFLLFIASTSFASSDLELSSLNFDVVLNDDGSMNVTETWQIKIKDTNTLFKTFDVDKTKYKEIVDVSVAEVNNANYQYFEQINQEMYHVTKGCFYGLLINSGRQFEIAWGVSQKNTTKTYEIKYKVINAVKKYNDCNELYWQFIGDDFEIYTKKLTGTITLPNQVSDKENIRAWAHGPLNGNVSIVDNQTVEFEIQYLNPNNYVELRVVTLEDVFLANTNIVSTNKFDIILSEETILANKANEVRTQKQKEIRNETMIYGAIILLVLGFGVYKVYRYWIVLKENSKIIPTNKIEYFRELPNEETTPAEAAFLYRYKTQNKRMDIPKYVSSTMLDLCLKGFLTFEVIEERKSDIKVTITQKEDKSELRKHEITILSLLEKVAQKQTKSFTMKEFEKYAKKNSTSMLARLNTIQRDVIKEQEDQKNYDSKIIKKHNSYLISGMIYIFIIIFIIPGLFGVASINGIFQVLLLTSLSIYIAITVMSFVLASNFNTLTQKGEDERELWIGLKKYMEDFSLLNEKEVPELVLWEKYLVYATAFGIADKVLKQLKIKYPQLEESFGHSNSSYMYLMYHNNLNTAFVTSLNSSVSKAYNTGVSAEAAKSGYSYGNSSSGGGFGGGFSGGGGGRRRSVAGGGGR